MFEDSVKYVFKGKEFRILMNGNIPNHETSRNISDDTLLNITLVDEDTKQKYTGSFSLTCILTSLYLNNTRY